MTCKEFRMALEEGGSIRSQAWCHLVTCPECRQLVSVQEELSQQLELVRSRSIPVPPSVDSSVLTLYRDWASNKAKPLLPQRVIDFPMVKFGIAAAVLLVVLLVTFFTRSGSQVRATRPMAPSTPALADRSTSPEEVANESPIRHVNAPIKAGGIHRKLSLSTAQTGDTLPPGFRSLMYCDPLSCSGTMEVFRMRLPASAVTRGWATPQPDGTVVADVLVGPDGVARAIRIVN
jgi:hypothetical protein